MTSSGLQGEPLWAKYAANIAAGLITLLTLYRPACVVVGGSVAQHWNRLEGPLRQALSGFRDFDPALPFSASTLGEQGGALGAALLPQLQVGWHSIDSPSGRGAIPWAPSSA